LAIDKYIWQFTGYKTLHGMRKTMKDIPATSPESDAMSKDLKKRGYMQAAGMVNDHTADCFKY